MPVRRYAPALSKAAFKKVKPSGNYQSYLRYLASKRPGWDISRPGVRQTYRPQAAPPPQPTYESLLRSTQILTPAQLEARANRMAQTQMTYQRQLIDQEYAQAREDARLQMLAQQSAGRAAAAMNAELLGRVGGAYDQAGQGMTALGGALGAAMAGATAEDVAAANAQLGRVGAPGVSVGGPASATTIAGPAQADVEIYRGATLPARQLGTTSTAQELGIGSLISAQNLRATQEANAAFVGAQREAARAKSNAIKALAAGRPQAAMQFLAQLEQSNRQQVALAQGLLGAKQASETQATQLSMAKEKFKIDKSQVDPAKSEALGHVVYVDGTVPKKNGKPIPVSALYTAAQLAAIRSQRLRDRLAEQGAEIDWSRVDVEKSLVRGVVVDRRGKPIRVNGKTVPASVLKGLAGTTGGGGRTLTPGQRVDLMADAQRTAESLYYGYKKDAKGKRIPATEAGDFDPNNPETWGTGGADWPTAMRRLTRMGLPPAAARAILEELYPRGQLGRPVFSDAEAKRARKKLGRLTFTSALAQIKMALKYDNFDAASRIIEDVLAGHAPGW